MSRVAVVTGAASGIGLGVARQLAADGYAVALFDRNGEGVETEAAELAATGGTTSGRRVRRLGPRLGRHRVRSDPLDARARRVPGHQRRHRVVHADRRDQRESWDRIIAVNLTGTFACAQAAVPDMAAAGWGRIVTIASSSAQSGAPNMTHYAASKGGVISLTKALAVELARQGITANSISPSLVDTPMARAAEAAGDFIGVDVVAPMVPLGRAGTPADIAAACSYLCSEAGGYTTGQVLGVNGGMYI